ncbi:MAG: hypothetical protein IJ607_03485 [Bacteroidaceae bacterium]|nr:hypothetical protein [Bacteroidaceae bacterium]
MKKIFVYAISSALLLGTTLSSCSYSGYESYLGTMAGAEIGGIIGQSIGWMNTSRHSGPGNAMLGGIIGTVAGAAIGNAIGNEAAESRKAQEREYRRNRRHDDRHRSNRYQNNNSSHDSYDYSGGYQTEGGRDYTKSASNIIISNLKYEDENGDGLISKYETINVIYEITNTTSRDIDVRLAIGNNSNHNFEFSPETEATIAAGKTIRYKAKVFCKSLPRDSYTDIPVYANSSQAGSASDTIRIKNDK